MDEAGKVLYDKDSEEAFIGSLLVDPASINLVTLLPEALYVHKLRDVYKAIIELTRNKEDVDPITVKGKCNKQDITLPYLMGLINNTPSSTHINTYERNIRDFYNRRQIMVIANKLAKAGSDTNVNIETSISPILSSISSNLDVKKDIYPIGEFAKTFLENLYDRVADPKDIWGMKTGFDKFDKVTGGLQPSEMLILSGEPGVGKSLWSSQVAYNLAKSGIPGVYFNLEMKGVSVVRRLISFYAKVETRLINSGYVSKEDLQSINKKAEGLKDLPLFVSDSSSWETLSIRFQINKLKMEHDIKWVVIDYMNLLKDKVYEGENEKTAYISSSLKSIAKEFDVSLIVVQSLNKLGMRGDLNMANLRGSGQLPYDTDLILYITKSKDNNIVNFQFGKGRELKDNKQYFQLKKSDKFPGFYNMP